METKEMRNDPMDIRSKIAREEQEYREREQSEPPSLWKMVTSIHSHPMLREWVTLESMPLIPLLTRSTEGAGWIVHLLLATPAEAKEQLNKPWAYVAWQWPEQRVLRVENLSEVQAMDDTPLAVDCVCTAEQATRLEAWMVGTAACPPMPERLRACYQKLAEIYPAFKLSVPLEPANPPSSAPNRNQPGNLNPLPLALAPVTKLIEDLRLMLDPKRDNEMATTLSALQSRLGRAGFLTVVAGEAGRGKSTLVNRLLGRAVLQKESAAVPVRISYGAKEVWFWLKPGGHAEQLVISPETWCKFTTAQSGVLELRIPDERLKESGLQLLEFPSETTAGTGNAAALEIIAGADAVMVVVNATMPLSLTEQSFIEQQLISGKVPRVVIVVTRLEQLLGDEPQKVIEYIKTKLATSAPEVIVATALPRAELPAGVSVAVAGPEEMMVLLNSWANDSNHIERLRAQARQVLDRLVSNMVAKLDSQERSGKLSEQQRNEALQKAREAIHRADLDWMDLRIEVENRSIEAGELVSKFLLSQQDDLVEKLRYELRGRPNPKSWWEEDLPYRLKSELVGLGRQCEGLIRQRLSQDTQWVQEEAHKKLAHRATFSIGQDPLDLQKIAIQPEPQQVRNLNETRFYTRLGIGGATVLSYFVLGPLGIVASIGGGIVSERIMGRQLQEQKDELSIALGDVVQKVLRQGTGLIKARLTEFYSGMAQTVKTEEQKWLEARLQGLETPTKQSDHAVSQLPEWLRLQSAVGSL